jgi:hypothetical protein
MEFSMENGLLFGVSHSYSRRSDGVSFEPLFPIATSTNIREGLFAKGNCRKCAAAEMRGQTRMLLVLLLGCQHLETPGIAILDSLFSRSKQQPASNHDEGKGL